MPYSWNKTPRPPKSPTVKNQASPRTLKTSPPKKGEFGPASKGKVEGPSTPQDKYYAETVAAWDTLGNAQRERVQRKKRQQKKLTDSLVIPPTYPKPLEGKSSGGVMRKEDEIKSREVVRRGKEGGVLRREDEEKYKRLGAVKGWRSKAIQGAKERIGRGLEGGVLRKEDEAKYRDILPSQSDSPDQFERKIKALRRRLESRKR